MNSVMHLPRLIIILCTSLMMTACVSTKNVSIGEDAGVKFNNKKISATERKTPNFSAVTVGKVTFGALGAAAMVIAGNKIVNDNNITDPAGYISATLLADLTQQYGMTVLDNNSGPLSSDKPASIAGLHQDSNFVLDVKTINWSFAYFPTDWNNYRVIYSAKLRLIDTASNTVIAEGFCSRMPEKNEKSPSKAEMLADKAYVLKSELRLSANKCISEFRENVLSLPTKSLSALEAPLRKTSATNTNTLTDTSGLSVSDVNTAMVSTEHPKLLTALNSNSSAEMRQSAIEINKSKIYNDEGIFLSSINLLEVINRNKDIGKKEKLLIDGLSFVCLNLGHSKDERARSILNSVGANEELPKKIRSHAIHSIKIMDGKVKK